MPTVLMPPAILLMGPTASGKTAMALELASRYPIRLISVDSALVFKDMNIGTAKPDADTLRRYPHDLVDLIAPDESYSAARFREEALHAMNAAVAEDKIPLLVGGTMLYYKALLDGLADLPQADATMRNNLDEQAAQLGWPAMHAELAKLDPITAARLKPNDSQRIQRALEVCLVSGRPMSALLAESQTQAALPYRVLSLGLLPNDRSVLHQRIEQRFQQMLTDGLIEEVEWLRSRYDLSLDLPSMRCVGYRQVWEWMDGAYANKAELTDRGIFATRQLAKRQITWMTNTLKPEIFDCLNQDLLAKVSQRIDGFLKALHSYNASDNTPSNATVTTGLI
jgi:tRNA dimethylallyltransferase